jgi:hypothetical protein
VFKIRPREIELAINQVCVLERKLVDCRFPKDRERQLFVLVKELLAQIEQEHAPASTEPHLADTYHP